ncbi:type II CAAX endopeptidase family protein [Reichenbachiella sp.]|uniref:CPBP family intramembrane glutamic endopeptidase n=1 Tax=Reichenbachiella sp. TaxID=2184521 RepID=UPI003297BBA1
MTIKIRMTILVIVLGLLFYIFNSLYSSLVLDLVVSNDWSELSLVIFLLVYDLIVIILLLNWKKLDSKADYMFTGSLKRRYLFGFFFLSLIMGLAFVYSRLGGNEKVANLDFAYYAAHFSFIIFTPLEEILHRKIFLSNLLKDTSPSMAIIINSMMFTLIHIPIDLFDLARFGIGNPIMYYVVIFIFSSYLGFVYFRTRNIMIVIGLHFVYNLVVNLFALLLLLYP